MGADAFLPCVPPRLEIDGAEMLMSEVWVHFQKDPYPGGHRYRLSLPAPLAIQASTWNSLGWEEIAAESLYFQGLCMILAGDESRPWRYVLNGVDRVNRSADGVEFTGVCSPFVRKQPE